MPNLLRLLFFFITFPAVSQPIVYVTLTGAGNASGTSWTNALSGTLLAGRVATASSGTQFWIAAGTYKPTTTTDRTASFSIASGVSVYGGFSGRESALSERGPYADFTILSGDIGLEGAVEDNSFHVINLTNVDQTIIVDQLTVSDGYIGYGSNENSGAGIYTNITNTSFTLLINKCIIKNNQILPSLNGGGGIGFNVRANAKGNIIMQNCSLVNNKAGFGGAFTPQTIDNGIITSTVTECNFSGNSGGFESGAISNRYVAASPENALLINSCTFYNNTAVYSGGALTTGGSHIEISNCQFDQNRVLSGNGGAVDGSESVDAVYKNCLFHNNSANLGGAIYSSANSVTVEQKFISCDFINNIAATSGGAFYNIMLTENTTYTCSFVRNNTLLKNCIVWNNTAPNSPFFKSQSIQFCVGATIHNYPEITYSIIQNLDQNSVRGENNSSLDPLFVDPANVNYRLKPNSPAINAGDPNTMGLPAFDLAGQVRVQNGRVDMGAFEFGCVPATCQPVSAQRIR